MIYVNCPTQQDFIIKTLEEYNSDVIFKFESKQGIKLSFSINTEDLDFAVKKAKEVIKSSSIGSSLYFQVTK
ncbi:MAG: hypothetical protein R3Y12_08785 [Clostridia bacterium]